jgi:DNA helicase-2/ATP-dependent DNA helicase PcrA
MIGMEIPVVEDGRIVLSEIVSVECSQGFVYDVEIAKTGIVIADKVVSHNSIYKFRGADISNILNFENDYPDATVVKLEQNYRSTKHIIDAANAVIRKNKSQKDKTLWTLNDLGEKVCLHEAFAENNEAEWIASKIFNYRRQGEDVASMAVLYRANFQSRVLERAMLDFGIPYDIVGGITFFERKEIKDLIAYLRIIANKEDFVSLLRIINVPKRGIGNATIEKIRAYSKENNLSLFSALTKAEEIKGVGKRKYAIEDLIKIINEIEEKDLPIAMTIEEIMKLTNYEEYLKDSYPDDYWDRKDNIEELLRMAEKYDKSKPKGEATILEFLQETTLQTDLDKLDPNSPKAKLMTVHNAKGLEFNNVFVCGLEEGIFPHIRSLLDGDVEEERRLCYVALSRAKKRLFLSYSQSRQRYGQGSESSMPSRFLGELPKELLQEV